MRVTPEPPPASEPPEPPRLVPHTSVPTSWFRDPLDQATLDRFTLQLRAQGLVQSGAWEACAEVNHSESNQLAIRSA